MTSSVRKRAAAMAMEYRCDPQWVNEAAKLLGQCADELMRAEMYEQHVKGVSEPEYKATIDNLHARRRPLEAEITRLKTEIIRLESKVDTDGMQRSWNLGFRAAAEQLMPVVVNLLNASYLLTEPDHHHGPKETKAAADEDRPKAK
jgi:hypothetical protein